RTGVCADLEAAKAYVEKSHQSEVTSLFEPAAIEFKAETVQHKYAALPRHKYVFIRLAPKEHPVRDIFPRSEAQEQEVGWIHASVVPDLPAGTLVSFDQFSAVGNGMRVVDDGGVVISVVMIDEAAISSI